MANTMVRVATVKATGKQYLVQSIDFSKSEPIVHCWGEVVSCRGASSKHAGVVKFLKSAVDVVEVLRTASLIQDLFRQAERQAAQGTLPGYCTSAQARAHKREITARAKPAVTAMKDFLQGTGDLPTFLNELDKLIPSKGE